MKCLYSKSMSIAAALGRDLIFHAVLLSMHAGTKRQGILLDNCCLKPLKIRQAKKTAGQYYL
jgi:hypothetical protein